MKKIANKVVIWTRPDGTKRVTYFVSGAMLVRVGFPDGSVLERTREQLDRWCADLSKYVVPPAETETEFVARETTRLAALPDFSGHHVAETTLEKIGGAA